MAECLLNNVMGVAAIVVDVGVGAAIFVHVNIQCSFNIYFL